MGIDQAIGAVVQSHGIEDQSTTRQHATTLVVQVAAVEREQLRGADQSLGLVIQLLIDRQDQIAMAGERTAVVVQALGVGIDADCADQAFDVIQRLGNAQGQALVAEQSAAIVVEIFLAVRVRAWALEISPPWLFTPLRFFSAATRRGR
nr:hypothetical protein GCM10020185_11320 [Pseudomonas brassicacearum subsp. brassicacearum]